MNPPPHSFQHSPSPVFCSAIPSQMGSVRNHTSAFLDHIQAFLSHLLTFHVVLNLSSPSISPLSSPVCVLLLKVSLGTFFLFFFRRLFLVPLLPPHYAPVSSVFPRMYLFLSVIPPLFSLLSACLKGCQPAFKRMLVSPDSLAYLTSLFPCHPISGTNKVTKRVSS